MLISDLKRPCTECDGSGFQAGFDEWGSTYLGDKGLDGKRLKHSAGNEVGLTIQSLANDVLIWQKKISKNHF